jgi:hypothetical protein
MLFLFNRQYLQDRSEIDTHFSNTLFDTSLEKIMMYQNNLSSSIATYYFEDNYQQANCLVLSCDKNLAHKLNISISPDKYTNDLFPIDFSQVYIKDLIGHNNNEIYHIKHTDNNYFFFISKGVDAEQTISFIEQYKKRSYLMVQSWKKRKMS